jgi:PIN domain nuclease of toxin-antitoxin system
VKFLLDTHVWLWMRTEPERIARRVAEMLLDPDTELYLSAASSWEIAIKYALAKLPLPSPPTDYVPSRLAEDGILPLPITHSHALEVSTLPHHHTDPFDRLLIAQARAERLPLLTADRRFEPYELPIHWADQE